MITIDNDLRTINIPNDIKLLGVVGDDDVNMLEFEMPRRYRGHDLSECTIQIQYKNIERGRLRYADGEYNPTNIAFNDEVINFYWVVNGNACKYRGVTEFSLCLNSRYGDFTFNTRWASLPVLQKQFPPDGKMIDAETIEIASGMNVFVEDEILITSE